MVESEMAVTENYHRLFSALMLRMSACIGVNPPVPKAKVSWKMKKEKNACYLKKDLLDDLLDFICNTWVRPRKKI